MVLRLSAILLSPSRGADSISNCESKAINLLTHSPLLILSSFDQEFIEFWCDKNRLFSFYSVDLQFAPVCDILIQSRRPCDAGHELLVETGQYRTSQFLSLWYQRDVQHP